MKVFFRNLYFKNKHDNEFYDDCFSDSSYTQICFWNFKTIERLTENSDMLSDTKMHLNALENVII